MKTKFGILSKLNFLQNWLSSIFARINPAIIHNVEKYYVLKKVFYLSTIEDIQGDYLEFGVYTGSSFCHAMRCCNGLRVLNSEIKKTRFFGFDSFDGFGEILSEEKHSFYTDSNFSTSFDRVQRRAQRTSKGLEFNLVKGFFNETLKLGPENYRLNSARIIFIDSDTYSSAKEAFDFSASLIQIGTYLILDDFFSYNGRNDMGVAKAFWEFKEKYYFDFREVFTYGMGGKVFVVSKITN